MSRTYRKKHNFQTKLALKEHCTWEGPYWGKVWDSYDNGAERKARAELESKLYYTTDNGLACPWNDVVKHFNNRKARAHYRNQLAKVYRDYDYHPQDIPWNRFENAWNWD